jgi:hypothetical protein
MSRLKSPIRQKNEVLEDTSVFKTEVFARSKRLKVFDTSLFLDTEVFTEYFKITLKPNGALEFSLSPNNLDFCSLIIQQYFTLRNSNGNTNLNSPSVSS